MFDSRRLIEVLRLLCAQADRVVVRRLGLTLLLVVAGSLLAAAAPLALQGLVDAVVAGAASPRAGANDPALVFGALYLLALCGGRLLLEIRPLLASGVEQRLYARLRHRFFAHLLGLRLAFHLERRTGAVVDCLQQATTGYQLIVVHLIHTVVPVLIEVGAVVVVLTHLGQPALVTIFASTALAYVVIFGSGTARLAAQARSVTVASSNANATLTDSLLNFETLKCFNAEPQALAQLARASDDLETHWRVLHRRRAAVGVALTLAFTASTVASLVTATRAVSHGTLTIGGFVLANVYMLQVMRPLEMLAVAARDMSQALAFIGPLLDLLKEPTEVGPECRPGPAESRGDEAAGAEPMSRVVMKPPRAPSLSFHDIHFAYCAGQPVLRGLELHIAAGQSLAIVGTSGSGKSSLVRLLLRLYDPQAGRILWDRIPIDTLCAADLRAAIGWVPQDTVLFDDTIAANIGIGQVGAPRRDIERAARIARLHDFVSTLPAGYDTAVGERGLKLSGGERQRIAIARAVLKQPTVYVFDEATSMLDNQTEAAILDELRQVSEGCTTITIAHRLSTARRADEIVVIADGKIAERGTHPSLLARSGAYSRLWRAQGRDDPEGHR